MNYLDITKRHERNNVFAKAFLALGLCMVAQVALAGPFDNMPLLDWGCELIKWLKSSLAPLIFLVVAVITIIIGKFAKMDWTKILSLVILMGVLQGIGTIAGPFIVGAKCTL